MGLQDEAHKQNAHEYMDRVEKKGSEVFPFLRKSVLLVGGTAILYQAARSNLLGSFIHFYALAIFLGTTFWVTFIAGIIQWKNMKTKDFGTLQSHLFPAYFLVQIITCTVILLAYAAMNNLVSDLFTVPLLPSWIGLLTSVLNYVWAGPASTKVMFQKYAVLESFGFIPGEEKTDKKSEIHKKIPELKSLAKQFGKLHGISALANMFGFIAISYHAYEYVSQMN